MKQFKPGDVVTLKSGGPRMTVVTEATTTGRGEPLGDGDVVTLETVTAVGCQWFEFDLSPAGVTWGDLKYGGFPVTSLVVVDSNGIPL